MFASLVVVFVAGPASAQANKVFIANYDVKLLVDETAWHIQTQAKVRNGSTFPILFQGHRIDVRVTDLEDGQYRADLGVFENSRGAWIKINTDNISFQGNYSIPLEFKWTTGDIAFDLAISIAEAQPVY